MAAKKFKKEKFVNHYKADFNWSEEDQCFIASFPELPGCVTHGDTLVEAAQNADEAVEAYVASLINRKLPVPEPIAYQKVSGNIPFRTSQSLHRKLKLKAAIAHKSVNELIEEIIEEHIDEVD